MVQSRLARESLIRLGLVIASILVVLLLSELALIASGYSYTPLRIQIQYKSDWRDYHVFEDSSFVSDSYLIWRPKESSAVFNTQGYRGKDLSLEKEPGSIRIFTIGDSNTLGWGEPNGPNWPLYVGELAGNVDDRITVVNAGVWGYSSFQGLRRFEGTLRFKPDIVLVSFGANDAHQVTISDSDFVKLGGRRLSFYLGRLLNRLRIGQLALAASDKLLVRNEERLISRVSVPEYKANLEEIIRLARANGIQVVLLTRPYLGDSKDERWWKTFAPNYNAATIETAASAGIPSIDVYTYFKNKKEYFSDESHFNGAGHRTMAGLIYQNLKPILSARNGS